MSETKNLNFFWCFKKCIYLCSPDAEIAQLVERNLAKVEVAGPSPVFRSRTITFTVVVVLFADKLSVAQHLSAKSQAL